MAEVAVALMQSAEQPFVVVRCVKWTMLNTQLELLTQSLEVMLIILTHVVFVASVASQIHAFDTCTRQL
jgi:hypothetical protein